MPRIRKTESARHPVEPFWKIGLYIRLSREDENEGDSESVINQEKILRDFVADYFEPGSYKIAGVFSDDGLSGTDMSRPGFKRITDCIISREVNCMIVKSLARGFRNLADQQKFLEEFVPINGARFICTGTPFIDTYRDPRSAGGLEIPIRGMFNEQFAATTSEEIRKTFKMKRERGEFIGAFAPYGYKKDPENKNRLIVDERAAEIVRCIFKWFISGMSKRGIAQKLNLQGEPNPEAYKKKLGLKYQNPNSGKNDGLWSACTVSRILQNEVYVGTMVQGRNRVISYKVHKQVAVPENEWFRVTAAHEAIIDRETFDKALALHRRDTRTAPEKSEVYLFSGLIRCADCQKAMHRKTAKGIVYYSCRTYSDKKTCTKHTIREDKLESAVLAALQVQIALIDNLSAEIEKIANAPSVNRENKRLEIALNQAEKQLKTLTDASDSLYIDWKGGEISAEEYRRLKAKLAEQIKKQTENAAYLREQIQKSGDLGADDPYLTAFLKYRNITSLNRGILVELVDAIWVHEGGEITIDFNFADEFQRAAEFVENNKPLSVSKEFKPAV